MFKVNMFYQNSTISSHTTQQRCALLQPNSNLQKRGHYGPHPQWNGSMEWFFLAEITKTDHQYSENYFFLLYVLTELVMNLAASTE